MTLTRLQPGMHVLYAGREHVVTMVNECRARIVPVEKRVKVFVPATGKRAGQAVQFAQVESGHNISPESELEVVAR